MASKGMKGLLEWCKRNTQGYKNVKVTNMTTSWTDGLAFCALLHNFRPDLIDFDSLKKENKLYNNDLAFSIAEKELGIAALLDAEDMANMKVPDKLSVMTYLSQYYSFFRNCKPGDAPKVESVVSNPIKKTGNAFRKLPEEDSVCVICGKHVHLVQRYFDGGKLYHRTCHRTDSLKNIRAMNVFNKEEDKKNGTLENTKVFKRPDSADEVKKEEDVDEKKQKLSVDKSNLALPGLVETLSDSKVETIEIKNSTPSPLTEDSKPLQDVAPSLISELPKPKEETNTAPRPRARTVHLQYDKENGNESEPKPPKATPRTKVSASEEKQELGTSSENDYDSSLNPFELSSGRDSDTTLSSSSSDEDDDSNPFVDIFGKMKKSQGEVESEPKNKSTQDKDATIEADKKVIVEPKQSLNPFDKHSSGESGDEDLEMDESNPFSPNFKESPAVQKKKKAPPRPPSAKVTQPPPRPHYSPTKSPLPPKDSSSPKTSPNHVTTDSSPQNKPSVRSPPSMKAKSPPPEGRPPPPTRTKKQAPPRPDWKNSTAAKMEALNKANDSDPRNAHNQFKVEKREPTAARSPASNQKTHNPSHKKEKSGTKMKTTRPQRAAPGYGYPLIKRKVSKKMTEEEISNEISILDLKLSDLEVKGVKLEGMLRFAMNKDIEWSREEDELLQEWFELVHKKNILLRKETDLVFLMQQQNLEQEHAEIEFQLRKIFNKPDSAKTDEDKVEEEMLLKRLMQVVESRNIIVNSIEEERIKEAEEDAAYDQMKRIQANPNKKKKKHKVKKMFSKHGKKNKQDKAASKA